MLRAHLAIARFLNLGMYLFSRNCKTSIVIYVPLVPLWRPPGGDRTSVRRLCMGDSGTSEEAECEILEIKLAVLKMGLELLGTIQQRRVTIDKRFCRQSAPEIVSKAEIIR